MSEAATPELLYFECPHEGGNHTIACLRWGDPRATRTVLCVHGLTRNGRDFDFLAEALRQDYQVLCPDMAGRGKSAWLPVSQLYTNPQYLADIFYILKELHIAKVTWIGTSMGGILGMMAANTAPGLIDALVLNDIGCVIPASGLARIRDIADMPTLFDDYASADRAFRKRCQHFGIKDEAHWQHLLKYGVEQVDCQWRFTYDPAIFAAGFSKDTPLEDVNLWPLWEAITKMPVLLIRGADSDILLSSTAQEMEKRHPRLERLEVPQCGHAPTLLEETQIKSIQGWMKTYTGQV